LDENNESRKENLDLFLKNLDPAKYRTDFNTAGSCNYAFTLVLKDADPVLSEKVMGALRERGVEFRRGLSGGGNQLRQPYLREIVGETGYENYPQVDHVHFYGFYIGNYPALDKSKILDLCSILNGL
jgi:CDP-6-deoxy-D-xylo-4-hexulose-3-dehydrase